MAELVALSTVASIVQLLELSATIALRLNEYRKNRQDVPKAFQHISRELPILQFTVQQLQEPLKSNSIDTGTKDAITSVISECLETIHALNQALEKLTPNETDSLMRRQLLAYHSLRSDSDIEKGIKKLRQLVRDLVFASLATKEFQSMVPVWGGLLIMCTHYRQIPELQGFELGCHHFQRLTHPRSCGRTMRSITKALGSGS